MDWRVDGGFAGFGLRLETLQITRRVFERGSIGGLAPSWVDAKISKMKRYAKHRKTAKP